VIRILAQGLQANKYNATWNLHIAVSLSYDVDHLHFS